MHILIPIRFGSWTPLGNAVPKLWVDICINVATVGMSISDTTVVVIDTALLAKTPKRKSGFWQDKLH